MKASKNYFTLSLIGAAVVALTACGGGGSGASGTASISTTVMDGLIQNALVCVDANKNGLCLLYTSPSPRDGLLSRMPSSA